MKTPSDVFNSMQVILAHLNDLKNHLAITTPPPNIPLVFGTNPAEVYNRTTQLLALISEIVAQQKLGVVDMPQQPANIQPRDIFATTTKAIHYLQLLKRRLGVSDRTSPAKASLRVSPSHIIVETMRATEDLKMIQRALSPIQANAQR